jgi:hypothetical protein
MPRSYFIAVVSPDATANAAAVGKVKNDTRQRMTVER